MRADGTPVPQAPAEPPISETLKLDELKLELGYGLLQLVKDDGTGTDRLTEQIKGLRRQLALDLGFVMPPVRILDNMQLEPNIYKIRIKEIEVGNGSIYPSLLMVMDPEGKQISLPGEHTTEPAFGLPATWIDPALRDEAEIRGYSIIDPSTVISTHLTEVLKAQCRRSFELCWRTVPAQESDARPAEAGRGHRSGADLGDRHPARAAGPAQRARLHPRPADHPRRHRRSRRYRPLAADDGRACTFASGAPALRRQSRAGRHVCPS